MQHRNTIEGLLLVAKFRNRGCDPVDIPLPPDEDDDGIEIKSTDTLKPFRFMDLPTELRLQIYEYVVDMHIIRPRIKPLPRSTRIRWPTEEERSDRYTHSEKVYVGTGPQLPGFNMNALTTEVPPILSVSRLANKEAAPIYYEVNSFHFYGGRSLSSVMNWVFGKAGDNKKYLRDVQWRGGLRSFSKENLRDTAVLELLKSRGLLSATTFSYTYLSDHSFIDHRFGNGFEVSHALCGLLEGLAADDHLTSKPVDDIASMSYAEVKVAVGAAVDLWWIEVGEQQTKSGLCAFCGVNRARA